MALLQVTVEFQTIFHREQHGLMENQNGDQVNPMIGVAAKIAAQSEDH